MKLYKLNELSILFNRNSTQVWEALCRFSIEKEYNAYLISPEQLHDIKLFLDKKQRRKKAK